VRSSSLTPVISASTGLLGSFKKNLLLEDYYANFLCLHSFRGIDSMKCGFLLLTAVAFRLVHSFDLILSHFFCKTFSLNLLI
jgi:hypothetical protein